jgi:hypothetical protein
MISKTYLYPQNLKATAKLWLWALKDFAIIGTGLLLSVFVLTQTGILLPAALCLLYAFLSIRFEDTAIMDYIRYAAGYFVGAQQHFEWRDYEKD